MWIGIHTHKPPQRTCAFCQRQQRAIKLNQSRCVLLLLLADFPVRQTLPAEAKLGVDTDTAEFECVI
jgi:hypothetical protein